jgi:myo-inositol-1(or 4)-monophosphatase
MGMGLSSTEISYLLETAVVAARLAGQRAMEEIRFIHAVQKDADELVTEADPICQKIIIDHIKENYPDHGFLAEENAGEKMLKLAPRGEPSLWWIIDPIDGTNNFANGLLCFSVSIAVMEAGKPIVGVVFEPATDSMFTAAVGMESQMNGSRIQVNRQELNRFACFGIDSHLDPAYAQAYQEVMLKTRFRCLGSTALHLAYVAKGSLIGSAVLRSRLWDIAAGALLVERAGGFVSSLEGESLFPVDVGAYQGQFIPLLAGNDYKKGEIKKIFSRR